MTMKTPRMRADGQKNRAAILEAAAELFATQGFDVALEVIASKAGVSRMTLYRNFADREELALAIFERNTLELEGLAQQLKDRPDGFFGLLDRMTEFFTENAGFSAVLSFDPEHKPQITAIKDRCVAALVKLARTAKEHDLLRADIVRADVDLLLTMYGAAIRSGDTREQRIKIWRRVMALVAKGIDGPKR